MKKQEYKKGATARGRGKVEIEKQKDENNKGYKVTGVGIIKKYDRIVKILIKIQRANKNEN